MVRQIQPRRPIEKVESNTISAGSFEKNPWWQRINPFTPSGPYRFKPSEEGQKILNEFRKRHGKNITVLPNEGETHGSLLGSQEPAGYYRPGGGLFGRGGSKDPFGRTVYLDQKNPSAFPLAHELGHAFDKDIVSRGDKGWKETAGAGWSRSPAEFLSRFIKGPQSTFEAEVLAQKEGANTFANTGLSDDWSTSDLGMYPYQYINQGINQAEEQITFPNVPRDLMSTVAKDRQARTAPLYAPPGVTYKTKYDLGMTYPNTFFDYGEQDLKSRLGLALNQNYQNTKTNIQDSAKDYAKQELGSSTNPIKRTPSQQLDLMVKGLGY